MAKARLRLTFPADVIAHGTTLKGQSVKLREIAIPLYFRSSKAKALAAFAAVLGEHLAAEEGEESGVVWDGTLLVDGKNGGLVPQRHSKALAEPAFLSLIGLQPDPLDDDELDEETEE